MEASGRRDRDTKPWYHRRTITRVVCPDIFLCVVGETKNFEWTRNCDVTMAETIKRKLPRNCPAAATAPTPDALLPLDSAIVNALRRKPRYRKPSKNAWHFKVHTTLGHLISHWRVLKTWCTPPFDNGARPGGNADPRSSILLAYRTKAADGSSVMRDSSRAQSFLT